MSWKSLRDLAVAAERKEALLLERAQQHGLLVEAEFADLVQEQQAVVGGPQQAGTVAQRAGERALHVAEERRHRRVAAEGGAVHLDERAPSPEASRLLQLVDPPREPRLARAGRPRQKDRIA